MRLVSGDQRAELAHSSVSFAFQWVSFVQKKCERGQGVKPRWATPGLEFLKHVCETWVLAELSSEQFDELKQQIAHCIKHVIGDKRQSARNHQLDTSPTSATTSSPHHKMYQRIQSCPDPQSRARRSSADVLQVPIKMGSSVSEPVTPFIGPAADHHTGT